MTTLTQVIHGEPGVGKSWFLQSSPEPRLTLDADLGSMYPWRMVNGKPTRQRMVKWNPREAPPEVGEYRWDEKSRQNVPCPGKGNWQTCNVDILDFTAIDKAYAWLNAGMHPFRSVGMDSITFAQKRCKDAIASELVTVTDRQWGDLLRKMEHMIRYYCDLRSNPIKPIECITFLALTVEKGGIRKPAIEGGLSTSLPAIIDLEGYLFVHLDEEGAERRMLQITPYDPTFQAKDRTHVLSAKYGPFITDPDIEAMLQVKEEGEAND